MSTFIWLLLVLGLCACQAPSRYTQAVDSAPNYQYDEPDMRDAMPRYEPYREKNSVPYRIMGKRYTPLDTGKGYVTTGTASWYGQKFHGHLTSNGEVYDMFGMTAAHKTLPLPSYVKVTNLENQRVAIVRVNDRGPFHSDRIIDLSYAAAKKLGFHQVGTARVKLDVIHVDKNNMVTVGNEPAIPYALYTGDLPGEKALQAASKAADNATDDLSSVEKATDLSAHIIGPMYYIQVAALSDVERAKQLSNGLSNLYQVPAEMPLIDNIYRLRLGPLTDRFKTKMLLDDLKQNGYPGAYTIEQAL